MLQEIDILEGTGMISKSMLSVGLGRIPRIEHIKRQQEKIPFKHKIESRKQKHGRAAGMRPMRGSNLSRILVGLRVD